MFKKTIRFTPKTFAVSAIIFTIIVCIYYANHITEDEIVEKKSIAEESIIGVEVVPQAVISNDVGNVISQDKENIEVKESTIISKDTCSVLLNSDADINTVDVFNSFDFQPSWIRNQEFWDKSFEDRFERSKMDSERPPLKVILVPHSHNDPGWLKTFEQYFHHQSRQIINLMVQKLNQYKNLTFIWSEVAFLDAWWEAAHPIKQKLLKSLVQSGRLEITTGGWVMTDEANAHVFAMVNQLVEGHQWLLKNLEIKPQTGWSIDPFGHGSTQPYILSKSKLKGTIIQRIHYAWKQWLALKQYGDFKWIPSWSPSNARDGILTHNQPFDIYSIKHSCGPHPYICVNFDFRKVPTEYTEYAVRAQFITKENVKEKSEILLEQYAKTGSLFPHNVVLMPIGDDFRYNVVQEWDQQYTNYKQLMDYINSNRKEYKTEIVFGTPKDYFDEIMKRYDQYPSLRGDFFVYSDIFSEGRAAYWSGYFTTRPFLKILDRELEGYLRGAEILYTIATNFVRKSGITSYVKLLEQDYEKLVLARRNLALFQHHDAITGTSKAIVMWDYGLKLFEAIRYTMKIQQNAIQSLIFGKTMNTDPNQKLIQLDIERDAFEKLPKKIPILINQRSSKQIVLYNSLTRQQDQLVRIRVTSPNIKVFDENDKEVIYQINPVWISSENNMKMIISEENFEVEFIANLPPLSITLYTIVHTTDSTSDKLAVIYCNKCHQELKVTVNENMEEEHKPDSNPKYYKSIFEIKNTRSGDIQIENHKFKILFNGYTGFMKTITNRQTLKIMQCAIQFAAYRSAQFHSGAYLFMPDPDPSEPELEKDVLLQYKNQMSIIIASGPVSSEITVIYGAFLMHTIRIYHIENSSLSHAISIENIVDFENPPKNRETELFMRILSGIQNGDPPEFYSDQNGFSMQKRIKVERIGIEGNYFPITTMAYIQDEHDRLTLITNHAQGAASWQPGYLEVMLDRRTLYDDSRGMGEGVVDNRKTVSKYYLLLEEIDQEYIKNTNPKRFENEDGDNKIETGQNSVNKETHFSRPSLFANQLSNALNYPLNIFTIENTSHQVAEKSIRLISKPFPCDLHLLTLRSQPDPVFALFPSNSAFLILHRQGFECGVNSKHACDLSKIENNTEFTHVKVKSIQKMSLTGIHLENNSKLQELHDIGLESMELQTFNVTFM